MKFCYQSPPAVDDGVSTFWVALERPSHKIEVYGVRLGSIWLLGNCRNSRS